MRMNLRIKVLAMALGLLMGPSVWAQNAGCKVLMNDGWQYLYGEREGLPTDEQWAKLRTLNLPHDWSVETDTAAKKEHVGPFVTDGDYQKGYMLGGEAWYRNMFDVSREDADKLLSLYFEGAYNHATIYLNGKEIWFNHYGYQSFWVTLPKIYLKPGERNEVVVRVEDKGKSTRWYSGAGLFRHVWYVKKPNLYLDEWATSISTLRIDGTDSGTEAVVKVDAGIVAFHATGKELENVRVKLAIKDADGRQVVASQTTVDRVVEGNSDVSFTVNIPDAKLWTAETPYLYKVHVGIEGGDEIVIPMGVRLIEYASDRGLFVNGQSVKLRGGCVHHDHGLLGAASYNDAEVRKIALLKQYGFNAVRCSHNLPSEAFLHACDSLGMYVIDECFDQWYEQKNDEDYHNYFPTFYLKDLATMLYRDRNHPSVISWSIGNEIPGRTTEKGMLAARNMRDLINQLDPQHRPVTAALCTWDSKPVKWKEESWMATQSLDIVGYNYMWHEYDRDVEQHDQLMWGTETFPKQASQNWDRVEKYTKLVGDFVWTAMDYLGEAGIGHGLFVKEGEKTPFFIAYPYYNGWCGDIDLIGQKKPQSYYRDVVWRIQPITMAMQLPCPEGYYMDISGWGWQPEVNAWEDPKTFFTPHNLPNIMYDGERKPLKVPGKISNKQVLVNVYSRAKMVRLYLNGRLIDTRPTGDTYYAAFNVDYEPGLLRAVEWDGENEGASFELRTAGKPARLNVKVDKYQHLHYITLELTDKDGNIVHDYEHQVQYSVGGNASVMAAGNANPTDMESFRSLRPRLYDGRCQIIVDARGDYTISAKVAGVSTKTKVEK